MPSGIIGVEGESRFTGTYPASWFRLPDRSSSIIGREHIRDVLPTRRYTDHICSYTGTEGYKLHWAGPWAGCSRATARLFRVAYVNPSTGDTIALVQSLRQPEEQGKAVTDGSFRASILTGNSPYPYTVITWHKDQFYFTVTASSLAEQEVTRIAKSVQPVINNEPVPPSPTCGIPSDHSGSQTREFRGNSGVLLFEGCSEP